LKGRSRRAGGGGCSFLKEGAAVALF